MIRGRRAHRRSGPTGTAPALVLALVLAFAAAAPEAHAGDDGDGAALGPKVEGLTVDAQGRVLAADRTRDAVALFSAASSPLGRWTTPSPTGVAAAPDGTVVVAGDGGLRRLDDAGTILARFGGEVLDDDTAGVAVGPDGTVFATDPEGGRVHRFAAGGRRERSWSAGRPRGIAALADGNVAVVDQAAGRVERFTRDGAPLGGFRSAGAFAVAAALDGTLVVTVPAAHAVRRHAADGSVLWQAGVADGLNVPLGVAVDCRNSIYVADGASRRLHRFAQPGAAGPPCPPARPDPPPPPPPAPADPPAPAPPPPPGPLLGLSFLVTPVSGTVTLARPGATAGAAAAAERLTAPALVPMGTVVDLSEGRAMLTFAVAPGDQAALGPLQSADFYGGAVRVTQSPVATLAQLDLAGPAPRCATPAAAGRGVARAAAAPSRRRRFVWGDGRGAYRTSGNNGAATIRGTAWLTEDSCDGTRVRVRRGRVRVEDFARRRTVTVAAGQSYLAHPACASRRQFRIRLRPPAGTTVRDVTVAVGGRRIPVEVRDGRLTADVDLRGRPKGPVDVRITVQTAAGARVTGTRTYRTCAPEQEATGEPPEL